VTGRAWPWNRSSRAAEILRIVGFQLAWGDDTLRLAPLRALCSRRAEDERRAFAVDPWVAKLVHDRVDGVRIVGFGGKGALFDEESATLFRLPVRADPASFRPI